MAGPVPPSSTALGEWYANLLVWRPEVALFVNATCFVPVLMPFAPAAGVVARFPAALAEVLGLLGIDSRFVESESTEMRSVVLTKTASRQVLGVMNEFTFMAEHAIGNSRAEPADLLGLSRWLDRRPDLERRQAHAIGSLQRVVRTALPDQ